MTPSNLISINGKIFLYKGKETEYPIKPQYACRAFVDSPDSISVCGDGICHCKIHQHDYYQDVAAFERDCVLVEDQEAVRILLCESQHNPNKTGATYQWQIPDRILYSVSVEMESVEQIRYSYAEWVDRDKRAIGQERTNGIEYRTIARIKKEESKQQTMNTAQQPTTAVPVSAGNYPQPQTMNPINTTGANVSPTPVEEKTQTFIVDMDTLSLDTLCKELQKLPDGPIERDDLINALSLSAKQIHN